MALKVFSLGLIAFILVKILTPIFFANENSKLPLNFSIITVILNTLLSIFLFLEFGFLGIAAATVISSWFNVVLLYFYLFKNKYFSHSNEFFAPLFVILVVSSLLGFYLFVIKNVYLSLSFSYFFYDALFFITILISGLVVFFTMISFYKPFNYVNLKKQILSDE
jgi:putative peptidoglycan lipid II flippase